MTPVLKILFAEDNPLDAELVLRQLRRDGFTFESLRVDTEPAFSDALNAEWDLILSDFDLGSFNGLRALELVKSRKLDIPFILISGTIGEDLAVEAIKQGASDYLLKDRLVRLGTAVTQAIMEARLRRERRESEAALAVSESRYRLLVEQASDGIFTVSEEGRYTDVNARGLEMLQYSRSEFLGLTLGTLLAPTDWPRLAEEVSYLRNGQSRVSEFRIRRRDGTWFDAEISARALPDGQLLGIVRDLTERRRSEQALRESEERFRQIAENINGVFWITDPLNQDLLYVSPGYEMIWGRSCESLYGAPSTWTDAIHEDDRERVERAVSLQAMGGYHEVYRILRPDGTLRWVRDRAFPIKDASGNVYRIVGTTEDITDWRKLEEQFLQAQKLEAIGTLAGGIAHDFNNILGAIIGYIELAKMGLKGNPSAHQYLEMVLQGANRAASLVKQILAFSRQQDHQRVTLQLRHVVAEPIKLLRATIPAMIDFDVSLDSDLPVVQADPTQIHQVVMNLCTNAAHAMHGRPGRLGVKLEKFLMDPRQTEVVAANLKPGLYVRLIVSDTGCGMERSTLERIFEPFFTTKGPGEGTGLGLSVVHGIMQSHEGAVTVHSEPGEGTSFHLYFPADGTAAVEVKPIEKNEIARGSGQHVLFIDDEQPLAQLGQSILEALGYRATAFTDAAEALAHFKSAPGDFDLVITDLSMPGIMGTDLAAEILAIRSDIPVVLTTGYSAKMDSGAVQSLGIGELLLKPFSFRSLSIAVDRLLSESRS
ncbi:hybrid sensor histidine kinase/response regulator [Rariglobus hedericola]|uniref:histidine kinase n=1 Tax=Rariglobus hedericola TaxID=2597822 RepID=A0A556QNH6_9BACT|nr:PAS domain S-box protein [Rariglobus hedericola]TSJ78179.1 PAS domain S-box protein [Rariglobus hedericola]